MKKMILKATIGCLIGIAAISAFAGGIEAPTMATRIYIGLGGSWNSIVTDSTANFQNLSAAAITYNFIDKTRLSQNKLAPVIQVGIWEPIEPDINWLWGFQAHYKYLDIQTQGYTSVLPNAATIIFTGVRGDDVYLNNHITQELVGIALVGYQFSKSYLYLGAGASMFTINQAYEIDQLRSSTYSPAYITGRQNVWGYAAQIGYNYYISHTWFLSFSYTYAGFTNTAIIKNAVQNRASLFGPNTANGNLNNTLNTSTSGYAQELMFTANKVFEL